METAEDMNTILFDLDGTLIDSKEGITKSVQYALGKLGIIEHDLDSLTVFIGPPLLDTFQSIYGMDGVQALQAVSFYRERYQVDGYRECRLYPYVKEILMHLKEKKYTIGMASSKPEAFCRQILNMFGILDFFDVVSGASLDGKIGKKDEVLLEAVRRLGIEAKDAVLIGDTRFDAVGAKKVGMDCIGVSYGFGSPDELYAEGCLAVVDSLKEAERFLDR